MSHSLDSGAVVTLTNKERAVIRCAIDYYLDEGIEYDEVPGDDVKQTLAEHHTTATKDAEIHVQPGMDELYQTVFQQYARAIREEVSEDEGTDSMGDFFEDVFTGIVTKIESATGF